MWDEVGQIQIWSTYLARNWLLAKECASAASLALTLLSNAVLSLVTIVLMLLCRARISPFTAMFAILLKSPAAAASVYSIVFISLWSASLRATKVRTIAWKVPTCELSVPDILFTSLMICKNTPRWITWHLNQCGYWKRTIRDPTYLPQLPPLL